jgi:hypothetical protein
MFQGCENELVIAADWKEVAVVYGTLSPTDDDHYIRIQKAYLDDNQRALNFAGISDSLYFDTLVVSLNEFLDGSLVNTYPLTRIDGNTINLKKDSGVFANDVNYLYTTNADIKASSFFNNYSYRLDIENPRTGYKAFGQTVSVGQAEVSNPITVLDELLILANGSHSILVRYQEGKYAKSYDVAMDIRIETIDKLDSSQRSISEHRWVMFTSRETRSLRGFEEAAFLIPSASFFNFVSANIPEDTTVFRRLIDYDMYFYGIADDFYTYINVNQPSIGIVQKKPEFTNMENALGLFSSRYINKFENRNFSGRTREALMTSDATKNLGFVSY